MIMRCSVMLLTVTALGLAGCTALPNSGPLSEAVESQAAVKVTSASKAKTAGIDYALVDLNKTLLAYVGDTVTPSFASGFGTGRGGAPNLPLGVGDVVQVTVFESQSGGLFIPADAGSRSGNFVSLPNYTIGRDGMISVPYAGRIRANGRTVEQVQREIEEKLANRAIEPQAIITKINSRSAQVAVLGDVNEPTKIELTEAGDRILDVVSQAGGLSVPGEETYITLQRGSRTGKVYYEDLVKNPRENIFVAPGDTVVVKRERRTYLAFGASGLNGRFNFEESSLTLGEALGQAGGLLDSKADPQQVLLYRTVSRDLLVKLGVDTSRFKGQTVPVIFRANLRDPAMFFAVQKFPMQDKDILYVTNSKSVELTKFLDILNDVTSTASGVSNDVLDTRNAIRDL